MQNRLRVRGKKSEPHAADGSGGCASKAKRTTQSALVLQKNSKQELYILVRIQQRVLAALEARPSQVRVRLHELRVRVHRGLALAHRQPAARRDPVHGRPPVLRVVRREEAVPRRERGRGHPERRHARVVAAVLRGLGRGRERLREDVLVHVAQVLEVRREEDVEVALLDEQRRAWHGRVLVPRLHDRGIDAGDRIGEGGEVGEEEAVSGEMSSEGAEERQ